MQRQNIDPPLQPIPNFSPQSISTSLPLEPMEPDPDLEIYGSLGDEVGVYASKNDIIPISTLNSRLNLFFLH